MYEFHGWFVLSESTVESDTGGLDKKVQEIARYIESQASSTMIAAVQVLNGQYSLTITGDSNRRRGEELEDLIELVRQRLPGSWGLLYERDDHLTEPPGPNAFQVTVLARGKLTNYPDPFLSPCNPTIED